MEQRDSESAPGFWPILAAVFIAGWIGGIAATFLWSLIGGYAVVDVLRGFKPTAGRPSLIETFALTLVGRRSSGPSSARSSCRRSSSRSAAPSSRG
jgi:predicted anti-sigma-YlaC factor YlaD